MTAQRKLVHTTWVPIRWGDMDAQGHLVNASCTFIAPLTYPGTVEVRMYVDPPGRTSIGTHYELRIGEINHAEGSAKLVWIDQQSLRSAPLPDRVAALAAQGEEVPGP